MNTPSSTTDGGVAGTTDGGVAGTTDGSTPTPEEEGYIRVPCRDAGERVTDLSAIQQILGVDYVSFQHVYATEAGSTSVGVRAEGGTLCASDACTKGIAAALAAALAALGEPGQPPTLPADEQPWAENSMMGPRALALIVARGDAITSITTTKELRALLGEIDSPWKAHLLLYVTEKSYDVSCQAYTGGGESAASYVRAGDPHSVLGVKPAQGCSQSAEAFRVTLEVARTGATVEVAASSLWKGATACEGRIPDALARDQAAAVLDGSSDDEGAYFARMAYFEQAAVHAFDILLADLAPHDAPPDLMRDLERSRRDEVRHARMMKRLAERAGRETVTPRVARPARRSLEEIALENAVEGCVRETYGAVVGLHQAHAAEDPRVRAVIARIADDELRHADVSWRLHAWLETRLDEPARERVRAAQREAIAALASQIEREPSLQAKLGLPTVAKARDIHARLSSSLWAAA